MKALWVPAAVLLTALTSACGGIPENEFILDYEDLYCSTYVLCASDEMLRAVNDRECRAWYAEQPYPEPPNCRYDKEAAEGCRDALALSGCVDDDPEVPAICETVYSGCLLPELPIKREPEVPRPEDADAG